MLMEHLVMEQPAVAKRMPGIGRLLPKKVLKITPIEYTLTDPKQNKPKMCQHGYRVDLARSKRSLGLLRGLKEQYGIEAR